MTPMPKPELPPEAMYWTAFNEITYEQRRHLYDSFKACR